MYFIKIFLKIKKDGVLMKDEILTVTCPVKPRAVVMIPTGASRNDINGDGIVNNKDVTRFMQYNAGWDVEIH